MCCWRNLCKLIPIHGFASVSVFCLVQSLCTRQVYRVSKLIGSCVFEIGLCLSGGLTVYRFSHTSVAGLIKADLHVCVCISFSHGVDLIVLQVFRFIISSCNIGIIYNGYLFAKYTQLHIRKDSKTPIHNVVDKTKIVVAYSSYRIILSLTENFTKLYLLMMSGI